MPQANTSLTEVDNGKTIEVRVGDTLGLRLYENASTGYRWTLCDLDAQLIDAQEGEYIPESDAVGSGGEVQWTFRTKAAGNTEIKLKLWRPWEGNRPILKRFGVTVRIRS